MQYTGLSCAATSHSQDPTKVKCNGDPALATPVRILVQSNAKPGSSKAKKWFDGLVTRNSTFTIDAANAGATRLNADTYVFIYSQSGVLLQTIKFHTSCSQPLNQDDQFGSLKLVGFNQ
jgi:hypothetical protein